MATKKTTYTWIILILIALGLCIDLIGTVFGLIGGTAFVTGYTALAFVLTIIAIPISVIWFKQLYDMSEKKLLWTNIGFGYFVGSSLLQTFVNPLGGLILLFQLPILLVVVIIWITFVNHLKKQ